MRLLSITGLSLVPIFLLGQVSGEEEIISEIREAYQLLDTTGLEMTSGFYLRNPRDGHSQTTFEAYFDQGQLILLVQHLHDYGYFETTKYFLKEGQLSYVFQHIEIHHGMEPGDEEREEEESVSISEEEFYFHQGQLINKLPEKKYAKLYMRFNGHLKRFIRSQMTYDPQFTAQQQASYVAHIKQEFLRIEAAELTEKKATFREGRRQWYEYIDFEESPDIIDFEFTAYYEEEELVKLSSKWAYLIKIGNGSEEKELLFRSGTTDYYLKQGELFFVYDVSTYMEDRITTESRYYFHGFAMVQAFIKEGYAPLDQVENRPHPILSEPKDMYWTTWQLIALLDQIKDRSRF